MRKLTLSNIKKTLAVLLTVFFVVSVTAAAASALKFSPIDKNGKTIIVAGGNGGNGGAANGADVKVVAINDAPTKIGDAVISGNIIISSGGQADGGDGGNVAIGFIGDGDVDWDGAVGFVGSGNNNGNTDGTINNDDSVNNA